MIYNHITYVKPELDDIYPPGSIYISTSGTSPAQLFGGTWERIENQFLLAAGSAYMAGTQGGSADAVIVNHTHLLSNNLGDTQNMTPGYYINGSAGMGHSDSSFVGVQFTTQEVWTNANNENIVEASGIGKNMPPYLTVYMWKRVDVAVELISFSIEINEEILGTLTAEQGMTWQNWIHSAYNNEGFSIEGETVKVPEGWLGVFVATADDGEAVSPNDLIIDGYVYYSHSGG